MAQQATGSTVHFYEPLSSPDRPVLVQQVVDLDTGAFLSRSTSSFSVELGMKGSKGDKGRGRHGGQVSGMGAPSAGGCALCIRSTYNQQHLQISIKIFSNI